MDNLTAGNPLAHRVRVYYEGSNTIYRGMALCYNYDTTTNWFGGNVSDEGVITASTTTAEGSQNEGKYIRVEEPTADNGICFAGVVSIGGWCGRTGPRVLDIYVPNGAIVPVYTDKDITSRDKLYLEVGQNTLVNDGAGHLVAVSVETKDRSTDAGVVLAKIVQPDLTNLQQEVTAGEGPSDALWKSCPWDEIQKDPSLGVAYFDDFMGQIDVTTGDGWTVSQANSKGTIVGEFTEPGGAIVFSSEATTTTDYGLASAQLKNCMVKPAAGVKIWFEARVKINADDGALYIGLAGVDTTLMDSSGDVDDTVDKAGFYHDSGSTANKWDCIISKGNAQDATEGTITVADGTYQTLGFVIDGITSVKFYSNGTLVETSTKTTTAQTPTAVMCLSAAANQIAHSSSGAETLTVDWVKIAQLGGRA